MEEWWREEEEEEEEEEETNDPSNTQSVMIEGPWIRAKAAEVREEEREENVQLSKRREKEGRVVNKMGVRVEWERKEKEQDVRLRE